MTTVNTIDGDLRVTGDIRFDGSLTPKQSRSSILSQRDYVINTIPLTDFRVWDSFATNLPATSAADDLGLYGGTFATSAPMIKTYDVKAAGAVTLYARGILSIPENYVAAESVSILLHAGMGTTVADTSATIDIQAYKSNEEGGISSDLCTTSAQSINSLTMADKTFVLTATSLSPGDQLDVRIAVAVNDAATATAVIAQIGAVQLLTDVV